MMFMQYFIMGATWPIISLYLKQNLGFAPNQIGNVLAMQGVAALVVPPIVAQLSDRVVRPERLLGITQVLTAGAMFMVWRQTEYPGFLFWFLTHAILFMPTYGLTNTIALHHLPNAKRDFGGVRAWGTVGWVVVGWAFGFLWMRAGGEALASSRLGDAFLVSSMGSLVLGLYAFTLPVRPVGNEPAQAFTPFRAFRMFANPMMLLLCTLALINGIAHQYYYFGMAPYLRQRELAEEFIMPALSIGQISEVIMLFVLGRLIARLGIRWVLILGVSAQVIRTLVFASGAPMPITIATIAAHGVCFACFFATVQLYVDSHSPRDMRGSAQQLLMMILVGLANLGGHLTAGRVANLFLDPATQEIAFQRFWLVPAGISITVGLAMLLLFREEPPIED
jgi:nucleoside transporter